MLRFKSILSRLIFLHVVVIVVAAIFIPLVLFWFLDSDVDRLQQNALKVQAEAVARNLKRAPDGKLTLALPMSLRHQYSEAYGRYFYTVLDQNGAVLFSSSQQSSKPIFASKGQQEELAYFKPAETDRSLIGVSLRKELEGQVLYFQVAEDIHHRDVLLDDVMRDFFQRTAMGIVPILLILFFIDILIFRRAMAPIVDASEQAGQISPARIDRRLTIKETPQEIASLVAAFNQALDRLERGFRRQQEFAADAAHELRTPLAIFRARAETLSDKTTGKVLLRDIDSMTRTVAQLLDAVEIESIVIGPGEVADLRQVCAEIAEFIAPLALAEQKSLALLGSDGPVLVKGNSEMLRRAIRNLVENAIRHTPPGTAVEIYVGEDGVAAISDDGAGVAPADRERIFQRRLRGDGAHNATGGAGLGLSVVKRIIEAHEGEVAVETSDHGGARFVIRLPSATSGSHE